MSLEYTSKFIKISHFAIAYVADEKLRVNRFEIELNPRLKEKMSIQHTPHTKTCTTPRSMWKRANK